MEEGRWQEATSKARDAYLLRSNEPEIWQTIARLMTRTGQTSVSIDWWRKLDEVRELSLPDRREYAAAAMASDDLLAASVQIAKLLATANTVGPADNLLAAQLAARNRDGPKAVDFAERVMTGRTSKPEEILSAAYLVLSFTNVDSPPYANAWGEIEKLTNDTANSASLDALVVLAKKPSPVPPALSENNIHLNLELKGDNPTIPSALMADIPSKLDTHPKARQLHHLLALEARARTQPSRTDEFLAEATVRFGNADDQTVTALVAWLNEQKRFEKILEILPLERAVQRREFYELRLEAMMNLQMVEEVRNILTKERFPLDSTSQHMHLAEVNMKLGNSAAATNEWQRALESSDIPDRLLALGSFAEQSAVFDVADKAYAKVIYIAPELRTSYAASLRIARARGETARAQQLVSQIVRLWPNDEVARNEEAYLALLMGGSQKEAESAERQAESLVMKESSNWDARATLALARLKLGRPFAALEAFSGIKATGIEPASAIAVRTAVFAATGYTEDAKADARNLGAFYLLPEERALIAPLLTEK